MDELKKERKANRRWGSIVWGIILILAGAYFLANNAGLVPDIAESTWAIILGAAAILFFVVYLLAGWQNWAILLAAMACGATAVTIWLVEAGLNGRIVGTLLLVALSIPFWLAFLVDRESNVWALIPGWILVAISGIVLLSDTVIESGLIGSLVMFAVALPFLVVYIANRSNWWALIPAYAMMALGFILLLAQATGDALIAPLVMFAIAAPFFVVFFVDRRNWWALIPGPIMAFIGLVLLFEAELEGGLFAALILFAIALPFLIVFIARPKNWWALLPAGILITIGLSIIVASVGLQEGMEERVLGGIIIGGIGLTFGIIWLLRNKYDTDWAKYPAAVLLATSVLVILVGIRVEMLWAMALIGLGLWILLRASRPKEKSPTIDDSITKEH